MKTDQLVEILTFARQVFPHLSRITVYGSARYVNKKSAEDLRRLREAGLNRVHTGMESGDDVTLKKISKGTNAEEIIAAGLKLKEAGIQTSEYFLVGIAGRERSREHALASARVLSAFSPDFIRIRTFVPIRGTSMYDDYEQGAFELLSPHEALREIRCLIENLECQNSRVVSDHVSNYWNVEGVLPQDRSKMLQSLDQALAIDESHFRSALLRRL